MGVSERQQQIENDIRQLIQKAEPDTTVIFVMSQTEQRLAGMLPVEGLDTLMASNEQILNYEWFSSILHQNRIASGAGPGVWKDAEANLWKAALILPKKAFVVFHLDPYLSADCCLALLGLFQWASDVSQRQESNIRVLATGNKSQSGLLSELAGIYTKPVASYQLPVSTEIDLIPEECAGNIEGNEIITKIFEDVDRNTGKHAILFVPPPSSEMRASLDVHSRKFRDESISPKFTMDSGETLIARMNYQRNSMRYRPKTVVIDVGLGHTIPDFLTRYTHCHIVLGNSCERVVFDAVCGQLVTAKVALSKDELDEIRWWCDQPLIKTENLHIYGGLKVSDSTIGRPVRIEHDQAGGFIAAVCGMSNWGINVRRVLRCFIKNPLTIREMLTFLHGVGILKPKTLNSGLTDKEDRIFRAVLGIVRYDYRLARFLSMPCADVQVRRLKVQIAVLLILKDDWKMVAVGTQPDSFWGWCSRMSPLGGIWRDLSLWKRLSKDHVDFENGEFLHRPMLYDLAGVVQYPSYGCVVSCSLTRKLEAALNGIGQDFDDVAIPAHRIRDETDHLSFPQFLTVWRQLLVVFFDQLVVTSFVQGDGEPRFEHQLKSKGFSIELRHESGEAVFDVSSMGDFEKFTVPWRSNVVYGICLQFVRKRDCPLVGTQWNFIPPQCIKELVGQ
ncbi:hypothetical protein FGRMN_8554 [Fusarium graminum]|nr:hypothetical protein FGRMN_8554 [Fusarium graminum]